MSQNQKETDAYTIQIYNAIYVKYKKIYPDLISSDTANFSYKKDVPFDIRRLVAEQSLKNLGRQHKNIGKKTLRIMWEAYTEGYYHGKDEQYDTLKEWVDAEIADAYGSYTYINAIRLVIERALTLIRSREHTDPIVGDDGIALTSDDIVENALSTQIDNLGRAGAHLTGDSKADSELISSAMSKPPKVFRESLSSRITITITAYRQVRDGLTTLVMPNLTKEQVMFLEKSNEHTIQFSDIFPDGLKIDHISS